MSVPESRLKTDFTHARTNSMAADNAAFIAAHLDGSVLVVQAPSFVLHSLAFLPKPYCEAATDSDQLRLSFFHCSAPILCRSSLCVPRYRTIRSPAGLPGSIGWSTATISYAFRPLFAPATPFRPSFQVLDCNSGMSRSRQTLAGSRIADFTLMLIWAPEQPTMCPTRKLPRYATFRQIKGPH